VPECSDATSLFCKTKIHRKTIRQYVTELPDHSHFSPNPRHGVIVPNLNAQVNAMILNMLSFGDKR
jgi:hypothetical protein